MAGELTATLGSLVPIRGLLGAGGGAGFAPSFAGQPSYWQQPSMGNDEVMARALQIVNMILGSGSSGAGLPGGATGSSPTGTPPPQQPPPQPPSGVNDAITQAWGRWRTWRDANGFQQADPNAPSYVPPGEELAFYNYFAPRLATPATPAPVVPTPTPTPSLATPPPAAAPVGQSAPVRPPQAAPPALVVVAPPRTQSPLLYPIGTTGMPIAPAPVRPPQVAPPAAVVNPAPRTLAPTAPVAPKSPSVVPAGLSSFQDYLDQLNSAMPVG